MACSEWSCLPLEHGSAVFAGKQSISTRSRHRKAQNDLLSRKNNAHSYIVLSTSSGFASATEWQHYGLHYSEHKRAIIGDFKGDGGEDLGVYRWNLPSNRHPEQDKVTPIQISVSAQTHFMDSFNSLGPYSAPRYPPGGNLRAHLLQCGNAT